MPHSQPDSPSTPAPPALLDRYQAEIDAALRAEFAARDVPLYDTLRYHMGWQDADGRPTAGGGGKRLRPTLCLLACEAVGADRARALPAAVALEFVHNFSLIHDDVEDGDRYRRHRPTLWAVWGEPAAIAAGNALLTMGNLAMRRLVDRGVSPDVATDAARVLTEGYLRMMEGQYLDIEFENRQDIAVDDYLDMIARKTGALIEASLFLGALAGSSGQAGRPLADGLRAAGRELGAVFQIRDDILGVWGGPATGKPVGADIQRRKKSLPAVHALTSSQGAARDRLHAVYAKETVEPDDVQTVLALMGDLGTKDYCQHLAQERWLRARSVIESLPLAGNAAGDLLELGEYLLVRES